MGDTELLYLQVKIFQMLVIMNGNNNIVSMVPFVTFQKSNNFWVMKIACNISDNFPIIIDYSRIHSVKFYLQDSKQ